jgi:hypothetical protein
VRVQGCGATLVLMSEQTPDDASQQGDTGAYDPAQDPDSDPEQLQPRVGGEASGTSNGDPDADPDMLNPRDGAEAGAPDTDAG